MFSKTEAKFPKELVPQISKHLDFRTQLSLASICSFFYNASNPIVWQNQLIELGCSSELLWALNKIQGLEINYSGLYKNFKKICEKLRLADRTMWPNDFMCRVVANQRWERISRKDNYFPVLPNTTWKLLCLTQQNACITHAIQLIQEENDKSFESPFIEMHDLYLFEAMNCSAILGHIEELKLLYSHLKNISIFSTTKLFHRMIILNAAYSNNMETLKWLVTTLSEFNLEINNHILIVAAQLGNVEMMDYAVNECKVNIHVRCIKGYNVLQTAVACGKMEAAKFAIEMLEISDKVVTDKGENLLHLAFASGNMPTIKYILTLRATNDNYGLNIFHYAAMSASTDAMRLAITLGIDPNSTDSRGQTALHYALERGSLSATKCAIELNVDIKIKLRNGDTAIHFAAASGKLELFKYIVSLMDPEEVKQLLNDDLSIIRLMIDGNMGVEGLKFAESCGLKILIKNDFGENLLFLAAKQNNTSNVAFFNYLLEVGLKPEINNWDMTILHFAAESGCPKMVHLAYCELVKQDPEHNYILDKDHEGADVYSYANCSKQPEVIKSVLIELEKNHSKDEQHSEKVIFPGVN